MLSNLPMQGWFSSIGIWHKVLGFQHLTKNLVSLYLYGFHNHLERSAIGSYICKSLEEVVWFKCGDNLLLLKLLFFLINSDCVMNSDQQKSRKERSYSDVNRDLTLNFTIVYIDTERRVNIIQRKNQLNSSRIRQFSGCY